MGYIETLVNSTGGMMYNVGAAFLTKIPDIILTTFVIVIGYLFGWFLGSIATHAFTKLKFDEIVKNQHISKPLEKIHLASLLGWMIKWYTFVIFIAAGANYINLQPVTSLITDFAGWFPNLIIAIFIGIGGLVVAEFAYVKINHVNLNGAHIVASILKFAILLYTVVIALDQILNISFLKNTLLIIVAAVALSLAIALGIGFGTALTSDAKALIDVAKRKVEAVPASSPDMGNGRKPKKKK